MVVHHLHGPICVLASVVRARPLASESSKVVGFQSHCRQPCYEGGYCGVLFYIHIILYFLLNLGRFS